MFHPSRSLKCPISILVFCLALACACEAFAEPLPVQTPSPSPSAEPTPDQAIAKVDAVKAAIRESDIAMSVATERQLVASRKTASLDEKCRLMTLSDQTLVEFQQAAEETIAASEPNLPVSLTEARTKLTAAETKLKTAKDGLPTASPLHADVIKAGTDAETKLEEITNRLKSLDEDKAELAAALPKALTCAQGLVSAMSQKIAPLKDLDPEAKGEVVLPILNRSASDLAQVITMKRRVSALWGATQSTGGLMRALSALEKNDADLQPVTDGLNTLDADVKSIAKNMKRWLAELSAYEKAKRSKLAELSQQVIADPPMFSGPGEIEIKAGTRMSADLSHINAVLGLLEPQFSEVVSASELQSISVAAADLVEETRRFGVAVTLLQDALGGSFENFEADQVSLFYFTDVRRLMYALNPSTFEMGGEADARERAAQARRDLAEAELSLAEAQGQVNGNQRRLEELREEQRQSHAQFLSSDSLLTTSGRKLDELKARPDKDERRITLAEQRKADLQAERDAAKERDDALSNEQSGLPAKIREARNDLIKAQERVRNSRANVIRFALAESEAFARARDNTPFSVALPIASSTDPAKRVLLYAFADSKTIFLRGNPKDLEKVRDIIARFDRPAPQARMTLWSLELNSTADKAGARNFNDALESVEIELANTRARITTSLSFLRDCINEEVNKVAYAKLESMKNSGSTQDRNDSAVLRWVRLHFYQKEVLIRLGFKPDTEFVAGQGFGVTHFTLPDPAATTTLGEALMVLALANPRSRMNIVRTFKTNLPAQLDNLKLQDTPVENKSANRNDPELLENIDARFAFMRKAMGLDLPMGQLTDSAPAQQEIVRALQAGALDRVIEHQKSLLAELAEIDSARNTALPDDQGALETRRETVVAEILEIDGWMQSEFGIRRQRSIPAAGFSPALARAETKAARELQKQLNPLRKATARVAAADQMLKEMIIAVEDDLDRHFVQPMMLRLRDGLVRQYKGVGVGIIQRTSLLATNRALARVDASGSAQLALGEETDILEGVQQLANLYLAGATGNALNILGGLNALPRKDSSELYGLTTGGVFKVTPIFDPSGQALRFQFDHVSATRITEPDGTVNPQLPRVERHTVNTEVQLSNMELREISRFNANARLGLPKRTWGGLPIFNSIPWIRRNVPLIGWFVKKQGDAPFVQQSLIFGQTTMYPTIGDIMDLLRNPGASDDFPRPN
jgi:hypothetical protein